MDAVKQSIKRWTLIILGWLFIFAGVAFGWLPVIPGFVLILLGLAILSTEYVWAHHVLQHVRRRFPKTSARLDVAHRRFRIRWRRLLRRDR